MKATPLAIPDVVLLEPRIFEDPRGHFYESYNARTLAEVAGLSANFVQDNHSRSKRGVIRGLHYQLDPAPQGKLVRVVAGEIFDVAVDVRRSSPTFGKWVSQILSAENKRQVWIPVGFAHGFMALSDAAEVIYKATDFYDKAAERAIIWNDPDLAIDWGLQSTPLLSAKDAAGSSFRDAEVFG